MILEYKYDFDALLRDFDKGIKFHEHIDLVICWNTSGNYTKQFVLKSLLPDEEGNSRTIFGSTHRAFMPGMFAHAVFEVIILEDLLNYINNPDEEVFLQVAKYNNE